MVNSSESNSDGEIKEKNEVTRPPIHVTNVNDDAEPIDIIEDYYSSGDEEYEYNDGLILESVFRTVESLKGFTLEDYDIDMARKTEAYLELIQSLTRLEDVIASYKK